MMEYDVHTILDTLTFLATAWVVYSMYVPLAQTYQRDLDTVHTLYVVGMTGLDVFYSEWDPMALALESGFPLEATPSTSLTLSL